MSERAKALIQRRNTLALGRSTWLGHWEDLASVMHPRRVGFITAPTAGEQRNQNLYDGTPMQAARGLANALAAMLRPDNQKWFFIKTATDRVDGEAKDWIANTEERLRKELDDPKVRFREATGECDLDLAVFGTGVIYAGESERLGKLLHICVHLKDAVVIFGEVGDPEGIFITYMYPLRVARDKFGEDKLSEVSRRKLAEANPNLDEKIECLHAVLPRKEGRVGALLSQNLPYADIWIEVAAQHELKVKGFNEFPFIVPRFDTSSGEDYGRSPGMIALPDANTLQAMGETLLIAGQRAADPPLLVPNDGTLDAPNVFPGGLAPYDVDIAKDIGRLPIAPLEGGRNMPLTRDMQQDMRSQVFNAFYKNILNLPVDGPQMTAEEIRARKEELIREVGPVFGRQETGYSAPLIERNFKVMLRAGAFDPIPEALLGTSIRFEYESPVKKIRQQIEVAITRAWVNEMVLLSREGGVPEAMDAVNFGEYATFAAEGTGVPMKLVNSPDVRAAKAAARAQAQAEAQKMEASMATADAASKVMKAMPQPSAAA
ncbi:MAG: portal protein [Elusimicrobia bacterium]|nr:portal protein [Elusimicrobiota bacterium]